MYNDNTQHTTYIQCCKVHRIWMVREKRDSKREGECERLCSEFFAPYLKFAMIFDWGLSFWNANHRHHIACVCVSVDSYNGSDESRFQSEADVNANWIHKCDILSHIKYVGRNKLIGFSYINLNGRGFFVALFLSVPLSLSHILCFAFSALSIFHKRHWNQNWTYLVIVTMWHRGVQHTNTIHI